MAQFYFIYLFDFELKLRFKHKKNKNQKIHSNLIIQISFEQHSKKKKKKKSARPKKLIINPMSYNINIYLKTSLIANYYSFYDLNYNLGLSNKDNILSKEKKKQKIIY